MSITITTIMLLLRRKKESLPTWNADWLYPKRVFACGYGDRRNEASDLHIRIIVTQFVQIDYLTTFHASFHASAFQLGGHDFTNLRSTPRQGRAAAMRKQDFAA